MQVNLFVFVSITREWVVWIFSADLLVSVDQQTKCGTGPYFCTLIKIAVWRLHATAECS